MNTLQDPKSLAISIKGEIVSSNFPAFKEALREQIQALDVTLATDADFITAEDNSKALKAAEVALKEAKAEALEQAAEVQALFSAIDEISEEARQARLSLERQIKARKVELRNALIADGLKAISYSKPDVFKCEIEDAAKGKKTIDSIRKAIADLVASTNARLDIANDTICAFEEEHGNTMTPDWPTLLLKPQDLLELELASRLERKKAEEEKRRILEEKSKAEEEARQARKEQAAAEIRQEKLAEPKPAAKPAVEEKPAPPVETKREPATKEATEEEELETFCSLILAQFAPIKEARLAIKHEANQEKAAGFADAVGAAFKETLKG